MNNIHKPYGPYEKYFKRPMDFTLSLIALIVLSPLLLILTVTGAVAMRGNPFFTQERPGKDEKIFKLIKFRSMSNRKDASGKLLPDEQRLSAYGRILRKSSFDELPSLVNIIRGDLSIVGPRPLLVKYLPRYSKEQHRRHEVRPGLSGYAQVHGRNAISWEEKFKLDVEYVDRITFWGDVTIILLTVWKAFVVHEGVSYEAAIGEFMGNKKSVAEDVR